MERGKARSVAVVGLGYVGLPIAVAFGKQAPVIGFDINRTKIEELRRGIDRTGEVSTSDLKAAQVQYAQILSSWPCPLRSMKRCSRI
jgi:UDP-N-acetyl-D-glucosamine/UDP-N-acetyl-D-galactosamine dehydrogenase